jgi:hypothetical protein
MHTRDSKPGMNGSPIANPSRIRLDRRPVRARDDRLDRDDSPTADASRARLHEGLVRTRISDGRVSRA